MGKTFANLLQRKEEDYIVVRNSLLFLTKVCFDFEFLLSEPGSRINLRKKIVDRIRGFMTVYLVLTGVSCH